MRPASWRNGRSDEFAYIAELFVNAGAHSVILEFDSIDKAKNMHADLQVLWGKVEGTIMTGPQTRFLEIIEVKEC